MKRLIMMIVPYALMSVTPSMGADTITLPAKNGAILFNHRKHAEMAEASPKRCTLCHPTMAGGRIPGFGKDMAHKNCRGCHEEKKAGPTKCGQCHRKQ